MNKFSVSLAMALCLASPTIAAAEVDDLVGVAAAHHAQGDPKAAVTLLLAAESQRAGDPDFDYALGLAAADAGMPGVALPALQRVLATQPGNAQARAEIARVYAMAGDIDTARAEFDTVVADPSLPDPVRQRFDRLIRDYDRQIAGGGGTVSAFVEVDSGYDSNVNQATAAGSVTLPVFAFLGPATLGPDARRMEDAFVQAQGGVSLQAGVSRTTRVFASLLGFARETADTPAFNQAAVTGAVGVGHTLPSRDVVSLSGQAQDFWLGGQDYRSSFGVIGQYTHALSGGRALSFTGGWTALDYRGDKVRDADRWVVGVSYADRTVYAAINAGGERTRSALFRHLGNDFAKVQVSTERPISATLAVTGGLEAEYRDYRGADPLFLAGRRDWQLDTSLGLRAVVARGLSVGPRVSWTRNESNHQLYDYDRLTASVAVRAEF